jgi:predicted small metal-binding protein
MLKQVRCECGYLVRAESEEEVITEVLAHVARDHPALAETETAEDILSWIELIPD